MHAPPSPASLLDPGQVARIHASSLEVLERVGMAVRHAGARALLVRHGCRPDDDGCRVRLPPAVVERYRAMVPASFTFHGATPDLDRTVPRHRPVIVTSSSAPDLVDPDSGQVRRATSHDISRIARLVQALPGYDVFSIATLAADAPAGLFTPARLLPALRHCRKPIRCTTTDPADFSAALDLLTAVAGSAPAFRARPFVTFHYCPVVSPLTFDVLSTGALLDCVGQGLPVYPSIVPNAGLTSPMSMAGTLVQGNAEFLAVSVLMQMARPGTPTIYATLPTVADMRTGAYASGGIECGMLHMAFARMARFYNVPCGGYIGMTNAKVNDAQAGYETGMSAVAAVLGGADMLNVGGLLDALRVFDFGKAVVDDEIAQMLKRLVRGIAFAEEDLGLETIAAVGPGGTFIESGHTLDRIRTEALLPPLADRDARAVWTGRGSLDTQARALRRAREVLAADAPSQLAPAAETRIRAAFPALPDC